MCLFHAFIAYSNPCCFKTRKGTTKHNFFATFRIFKSGSCIIFVCAAVQLVHCNFHFLGVSPPPFCFSVATALYSPFPKKPCSIETYTPSPLHGAYFPEGIWRGFFPSRHFIFRRKNCLLGKSCVALNT